MSTAVLQPHNLLDPISPDCPAGTDTRWAPEWDRIREARRADDDLESGKWEKRERKSSDWGLVQQLCTSLLRDRSKDLQLVMWRTEANIKLHGFSGLRDGLQIARELMVRYWDMNLYPAMEDGPEDRTGPFDWLNNKLVDSIVAVPLTIRGDDGQDYSLIDFQDARRIGSESGCRTPEGDVDVPKKKAYDQAVAAGHISLELFDAAIRATSRSSYEQFSVEFQQVYHEFKALEKVIDEKFGEAAPNLAGFRSALADIKQAIADILDKKRRDEPDAPAPIGSSIPETDLGESKTSVTNAAPESPRSMRSTLFQSQTASPNSWRQAELLIRSGEVDRGLQDMTSLAAAETSGRDRFQRKLLLAEACIASKRDRLARSILEELAEQIDKFQLELWESTEVISNVWTRLYRLYKQSADKPDLDRAAKLYERLCRLDPWQALACS